MNVFHLFNPIMEVFHTEEKGDELRHDEPSSLMDVLHRSAHPNQYRLQQTIKKRIRKESRRAIAGENVSVGGEEEQQSSPTAAVAITKGKQQLSKALTVLVPDFGSDLMIRGPLTPDSNHEGPLSPKGILSPTGPITPPSTTYEVSQLLVAWVLLFVAGYVTKEKLRRNTKKKSLNAVQPTTCNSSIASYCAPRAASVTSENSSLTEWHALHGPLSRADSNNSLDDTTIESNSSANPHGITSSSHHKNLSFSERRSSSRLSLLTFEEGESDAETLFGDEDDSFCNYATRVNDGDDTSVSSFSFLSVVFKELEFLDRESQQAQQANTEEGVHVATQVATASVAHANSSSTDDKVKQELTIDTLGRGSSVTMNPSTRTLKTEQDLLDVYSCFIRDSTRSIHDNHMASPAPSTSNSAAIDFDIELFEESRALVAKTPLSSYSCYDDSSELIPYLRNSCAAHIRKRQSLGGDSVSTLGLFSPDHLIDEQHSLSSSSQALEKYDSSRSLFSGTGRRRSSLQSCGGDSISTLGFRSTADLFDEEHSYSSSRALDKHDSSRSLFSSTCRRRRSSLVRSDSFSTLDTDVDIDVGLGLVATTTHSGHALVCVGEEDSTSSYYESDEDDESTSEISMSNLVVSSTGNSGVILADVLALPASTNRRSITNGNEGCNPPRQRLLALPPYSRKKQLGSTHRKLLPPSSRKRTSLQAPSSLSTLVEYDNNSSPESTSCAIIPAGVAKESPKGYRELGGSSSSCYNGESSGALVCRGSRALATEYKRTGDSCSSNCESPGLLVSRQPKEDCGSDSCDIEGMLVLRESCASVTVTSPQEVTLNQVVPFAKAIGDADEDDASTSRKDLIVQYGGVRMLSSTKRDLEETERRKEVSMTRRKRRSRRSRRHSRNGEGCDLDNAIVEVGRCNIISNMDMLVKKTVQMPYVERHCIDSSHRRRLKNCRLVLRVILPGRKDYKTSQACFEAIENVFTFKSGMMNRIKAVSRSQEVLQDLKVIWSAVLKRSNDGLCFPVFPEEASSWDAHRALFHNLRKIQMFVHPTAKGEEISSEQSEEMTATENINTVLGSVDGLPVVLTVGGVDSCASKRSRLTPYKYDRHLPLSLQDALRPVRGVLGPTHKRVSGKNCLRALKIYALLQIQNQRLCDQLALEHQRVSQLNKELQQLSEMLSAASQDRSPASIRLVATQIQLVSSAVADISTN